MDQLLGTTITGLIIDENQDFYFVQKSGRTFHLNKSEGTYQIGDAVEGFAYKNQQQDDSLTTKIPAARTNHNGFGTVTGVRRDLGVFVDIGLPDKDIVISLDDLPTIREIWPKKGDQLYVSIKVDDKDRMWGILADEKIFQALAKKGLPDMQNKDVTGTVYRLKMSGTYFLTEDGYLGFIHPSERFQEPRLGEKVSGRVIGLRPDGVLNVSLKPRAHETINDDASMILTILERSSEKKIPFTDKSDPDAIKKQFAMSKGQFKRAIGTLLKLRKIKQEDGYTYLLQDQENSK